MQRSDFALKTRAFISPSKPFGSFPRFPLAGAMRPEGSAAAKIAKG